MPKIFVSVALLLSICAPAFGQEDAVLISLREDFSGHSMRTSELTLKQDGTVVLESYDFYKAPKDDWHVVKPIRNVSPQDILPLLQRASEVTASLPQTIDEERAVPLDPENKSIRINFNGSEFFSGWAAYRNAPPTAESRAFQDAWQAIEELLAEPGA
jgi:hypothetical protein